LVALPFLARRPAPVDRKTDTAAGPRLYSDLAPWFHLLTPPADYAAEAAHYHHILESACAHSPRTLLELGSGGGNNASHLKAHLQLTLVDLSPEMLQVSKTINPECEHIAGDMRSLRLGRLFDAVFIHDAIAYMTTEADLRAAIETAFVHCRPGGAALFAPDWVRETFRPATDHGGADAGGRGMRYLEWTWDPDPNDSTYRVDFAYLLREASGEVHVEYDRHQLGLFSREEWRRNIEEAGFEARTATFEDSQAGLGSEVFLGIKNLRGRPCTVL
jgi:SAM-dependent methyltransferase